MRFFSRNTILFGLLVTLCTAEVAWWITFQFRESSRLEAAGHFLAKDDVANALDTLGANSAGNLTEVARSRRTMFAFEGATLGILVIIGLVIFYSTWRREHRMREAQDRFLTGATHELKTPLATIRLGLESLAAGSVPETKRDRYLSNMIGESDRLRQGLTNLLTAAGRLQNHDLCLTPGDLADDVRSAIATDAARHQNAGIDVNCAAIDNCLVLRDSSAIHLVLQNIISNAVKFSSRGDRVQIHLTQEDDQAVLRVSDEGHGIDSADVPHLFERFYRGSNRDYAGGTGLGLYLVKELVEDHSGKVEAHSRGLGKGSEFVIRLPIHSHLALT